MNQDQIIEKLKTLPGWNFIDGGKIKKEFEFKDFKQAIIFVNGVSMIAEAEGHHPDIDIRYNKVVLVLWTHSEGKVTEKDFSLAKAIDKLQ